MTKHRKREEWIRSIVEAAADEIHSAGYANLTMDAIVTRTDLSKGGVYRFFKNKRDVALSLFTHCYHRSLDFDIEDAVGWKLPIADTISRILFQYRNDAQSEKRYEAIWLQLVPETVRDEEFRSERARLLELIKAKFAHLARRLLERDGRDITAAIENKIETATLLGIAFIEGLILQGPMGTSTEKQAELVENFVRIMVNEALGERHD